MTENEMIDCCPGIIYSWDIMVGFAKTMGLELDINKTWNDNGWDELDIVDLILHLESELNIYIPDDVAEAFISGKPIQFKWYMRNKKLEDLGF